MLENYIHKKYLKKNFKNEFSKNKPFPHLILDKFFNDSFARKLLAELKKEKFDFKNSDLFSFLQTRSDLTASKNKTVNE